jgi:ABC-type antimicrobial peptide transport system permease subunit
VLLGAELARRLEREAGDRVRLLGRGWRVAGVVQPQGNSEDLALFMRLSTLQTASRKVGRINEIRLFAKPGVETDSMAVRLRARHPDLGVFENSDRGNVAEQQTGATLVRYRKAVSWLTALAAAIGLMIASYVNAEERRIEMATIVALGAASMTVLATLVARGAIVGAVGAIAGYALGAGIAIAQDSGAVAAVDWSWEQPVVTVAAAAALSMAASIPVSVRIAFQDAVPVLQE